MFSALLPEWAFQASPAASAIWMTRQVPVTPSARPGMTSTAPDRRTTARAVCSGWTALKHYDRVAESSSWRTSDPVDLSSYAGRTVELRWSFDTVRGPVGRYPEGWYIDDVRIVQQVRDDESVVRQRRNERNFAAETSIVSQGKNHPRRIDHVLEIHIPDLTEKYFLFHITLANHKKFDGVKNLVGQR